MKLLYGVQYQKVTQTEKQVWFYYILLCDRVLNDNVINKLLHRNPKCTCDQKQNGKEKDAVWMRNST